MPEHYRALVVILFFAIGVFYIAKFQLCEQIFENRQYINLCLMWLSTTFVAFVSGNFWIYAIVVGAGLALMSQRSEKIFVIYCFLLFAVPPFIKYVPGFGVVEHVIALDHYRLLSLVVLLPCIVRRAGAPSPLTAEGNKDSRAPMQLVPSAASARLRRPSRTGLGVGRVQSMAAQHPPRIARHGLPYREDPLKSEHSSNPDRKPSALSVTDYLMMAFLLWMMGVQIVNDTVTGDLRAAVYMLLDYWLPYYVASRAIASLRQFQQVAGAISVAAIIVACIAIFENRMSWLLYNSLIIPWDIPIETSVYLVRTGEAGSVLRAKGSLGHAIVLGYVLAFSLCMFTVIAPSIRSVGIRALAYVVLCAGMAASLSRGPWMGAGVGVIAMLFLGKGGGKRIVQFVGWGGLVVGIFLLTPWSETVISYLPFLGNVETGNIDYREKLLDVSLEVFMQSPFMGNFKYLDDPLLQQMRQGEGIIDMVNTYLQVALPYGAIGLIIFVGVFATSIYGVLRTFRNADDPQVERLGRGLCAAIIAILITIGTVSNIFIIPRIYFLAVGLCVGYVRVFGEGAQVAVPARRRHQARLSQPRIAGAARHPASANWPDSQ
ncbi:O-antigen ligase family protein [Rhodovastum atsumiense]|nr:O-antigen ligase family protein [Rhodovastum atsumiense]CAH2602111.1 O-antigen ligase family protein [Rhodovastum atsumiense]